MNKYIVIYLVEMIVALANTNAAPIALNPLDFGLENARNGIERYTVLLRCHQEAVAKGLSVNYSGIKVIDLEIPETAGSIPLPRNTDFAGAQINVRTNGKSKFLFSMYQNMQEVFLSGREIDNGRFNNNDILRKGKLLLVVEDATPWVKERKGYNYGTTRRDIFYLINGKSKQRPAFSYQTKATRPVGRFCMVDSGKKTVKNLHLVRDSQTVGKVFCIKVENQYRVELCNITIDTPDDEMNYGDAAIQLVNCIDVTLNDITINGTYSQKKQYGYGVNADNVNGLKVTRMFARSKWGVFGTNNMSNVMLRNCDINRFDIHCYGRDVKAVNCKFSALYNQFSSVCGKILFRSCIFTCFTPVLIESSYNAYTPFDLIFEDCVFNLDSNHYCLLNLMELTSDKSTRQELMNKCIPNIIIRNCVVDVTSEVKKWNLIETGKVNYPETLDYIKLITISGLKINNGELQISAFSQDVKTTSPVKVKTSRIKFRR